MPRPGGPWWWAERSRWAATIGGRRVSAPRGIDERDKAGAWAWYAAEKAEAEAPRPAARVADLFNLYLAACKERVARGEVERDSVRLSTVVLTRAAGFVVGRTKFGATPLHDVRLEHLESILAQWSRRRGRDPGTRVSTTYLATATGIIRAAFRWGVRPGGGPALLHSDPFAGHKRPKAKPTRISMCDRGDAARWLRWLRTRPRTEAARNFDLLQRCLIHTGARPSEFTRATWGEVRWDAGRTASGSTYGTLVRAEWKNARKLGKPRRIVLLPPILRALRRLYDRTSPAPDGLIFRSTTGRPWHASSLAQTTRRHRLAAAEAGVELPTGEGRIRGYLWRHLAASRLVMQGVDLVTIGDLLGTSPAMIARTYAHLKDDHVVAAAAAITRPAGRLTTSPGGSARRAGGPEA